MLTFEKHTSNQNRILSLNVVELFANDFNVINDFRISSPSYAFYSLMNISNIDLDVVRAKEMCQTQLNLKTMQANKILQKLEAAYSLPNIDVFYLQNQEQQSEEAYCDSIALTLANLKSRMDVVFVQDLKLHISIQKILDLIKFLSVLGTETNVYFQYVDSNVLKRDELNAAIGLWCSPANKIELNELQFSIAPSTTSVQSLNRIITFEPFEKRQIDLSKIENYNAMFSITKTKDE
jgi:hypothetical protein